MKSVTELYQRHIGEDIYVLGTGPSSRVFPLDFLKSKTVIGCNMAWKIAPVQYCVTIHPDLNIPEFISGEASRPEICWITGVHKCQGLLSAEHFEYAKTNFYFFRYRGKPNTQPDHEPSDAGRIVAWAEKPTEDWLYLWSSIAQTAVNLAANMGAKNIVLVGCDNAPLGENHHGHRQHTRWKGVSPAHRYHQYYEGMAEVRAALRKRGVSVVSMNPFLKLDAAEEDFLRLCDELGVARVIKGQDIAVARRPTGRGKFLGRLGRPIRRLKENILGHLGR